MWVGAWLEGERKVKAEVSEGGDFSGLKEEGRTRQEVGSG